MIRCKTLMVSLVFNSASLHFPMFGLQPIKIVIVHSMFSLHLVKILTISIFTKEYTNETVNLRGSKPVVPNLFCLETHLLKFFNNFRDPNPPPNRNFYIHIYTNIYIEALRKIETVEKYVDSYIKNLYTSSPCNVSSCFVQRYYKMQVKNWQSL
jgi:hypothetical protein